MKSLVWLSMVLLLNACAYLPFKQNAASSSGSGAANSSALSNKMPPSEQAYPCASELTPGQCFDEQQKQLKAISIFGLQARIAVKTEARLFSGGARWQHHPPLDDMAVLSPLGSQVATLSTRPEAAVLTTSDGKTFESKDIELLTEENLGWRLPLAGLSHWVLGRPTPRLSEKIEWNPQGRLLRLEQDGWVIEYPEYAFHHGYWLPKKMLMTHPKLTLKIVIQEWSAIVDPQDRTETSSASESAEPQAGLAQ